jgi:dTDP-4-amino-4,6-dideoxygalactose transaminase
MIPLVDLRKQYLAIKNEIDGAIARILDTGQFVLGAQVEAFEREFAAYSGVRHGIAVNSGTSALHLALLAAGVGPGDDVVTVPFTFVATVAAICYTGARPVFVDIDPPGRKRSCRYICTASPATWIRSSRSPSGGGSR